MMAIERVYNLVFRGRSREEEWSSWHERTEAIIRQWKNEGIKPLELTDPTDLKFYPWTRDEILIHLPQGFKLHRVLEVGADSGALSLRFAQTTAGQYVLLDNHPAGIEYSRIVAAEYPQTLQFLQGDALTLPFSDSTFDLAHSVGLIEHFDDRDVLQMMSEQKRVLRAGGFIYVAVPNFFSPYMLALWARFRKNTERYMPLSLLERYAQQTDLTIIHSSYTAFTFGHNIGRFVPEQVERFLGQHGLGFLNYIIATKK